MSLLWKTAVDQPWWHMEDMPDEFFRNHLERHLSIPDHPDPKAHYHYHPTDVRGYVQSLGRDSEPYKGPWTVRPASDTEQHAGKCDGPGGCGDKKTLNYLRPEAEHAWSDDQRRLFDPQGYEGEMDRRQKELDNSTSTFLLDYKLEHPDRVFKINEDGSETPAYDPRLHGA